MLELFYRFKTLHNGSPFSLLITFYMTLYFFSNNSQAGMVFPNFPSIVGNKIKRKNFFYKVGKDLHFLPHIIPIYWWVNSEKYLTAFCDFPWRVLSPLTPNPPTNFDKNGKREVVFFPIHAACFRLG